MTQTPQQPQWDYNRLLVEAKQQPDGDLEEATTVAIRNLNHLEGALREAEAKAKSYAVSLANMTLSVVLDDLENGRYELQDLSSNTQYALRLMVGLPALQQPKAYTPN